LPKQSTRIYNHFNKQLLLPTIDPSQYTSVSCTDLIDALGASASIGTVGDCDNAVAESVMGILKTELHRNPAALSDIQRCAGTPISGPEQLRVVAGFAASTTL
jgi:hypothetical protein